MNEWSIYDKDIIAVSNRGEIEHQIFRENYKTGD